MHVVIAGGGVGGLTAALCLSRIGAQVQIVEQAAQLTEVGAGLQLSPNAMKVYAALGLAEVLEQHAFRPEALEMRMGRSGKRVFSTPIKPKTEKRWGAPYLHMHRADLLDVLIDAIEADPGITLNLGRTAVGYSQTDRSVTLTLGEGGQVDADLLIGADGLHSLIRQQMLGPQLPRFTGNMAWRVVVPTDVLGPDAPPPNACVWVGAGRHAVTYRLRGGTLCNFVGVVERSDWTEESWQSQGSAAEALQDFDNWHPTLTTLLGQADRVHRWALFDRLPMSRWSDGRVCLLGDACHPTLPFMAQGAAMAIEDAYVLAACLSASQQRPVAARLQDYFDRRIKRTSGIQSISRGNMKLFHKRHWLSQTLTYGPMWLAGKFAPGVIRARQDPIYTYDAVQAMLQAD